MHKSLLFLCLFCLSFSLSAQNGGKTKKDKTKKEKVQKEKPSLDWNHELGINASFIIERILNFSDNELAVSPYLLTYNVGLKNWKIRVGVGGDNKKTVTTEEGFADSETNHQSSIDFRLGYGYQKKFGDKWTGTFGADIVGLYRNDRQVSDTGFDKIIREKNTKGIGAGPVVGIQYDFGKRLSLYAEGTFYYTFANTRDGIFFANFPELEDLVENTDEQELLINLPSTLYLVFKF